jgi:hypothetical protein
MFTQRYIRFYMMRIVVVMIQNEYPPFPIIRFFKFKLKSSSALDNKEEWSLAQPTRATVRSHASLGRSDHLLHSSAFARMCAWL